MEELRAESQQSESTGTIGLLKGALVSSSQQQIFVTVVIELVRWNEEAIFRCTLFSPQEIIKALPSSLKIVDLSAVFPKSIEELPGFYFDVEKNRYFPYKGLIPGSSSKPPSVLKPSDSKAKQADILCQSIRNRQRLLQARELWGNVISSRKGKLSFRTECLKSHASQPTSSSSNSTGQ